jgi:hypothetical protein
MTAQAGEKIIYKGNSYSMGSEPLTPYLKNLNRPIYVLSPGTHISRGYLGSWEVRGEQLFLMDLVIYGREYKKENIEYVFPGKTEVFADWFTGDVKLASGKMLHYVHAGFGSVFEEDIFLSFYKGVLVNERVEDNRNKPAPNSGNTRTWDWDSDDI